jgi:hypothetical protein
MDSMDDFQFKPITQGLGFHKKPEPMMPAQSSAAESFDLQPTLPRKGYGKSAPLLPEVPTPKRINPESSETVDQILKTIQSKRKLDFAQDKILNKNKISVSPQADVYRATGLDISAALLDLMLVVAAQLLCLIVLLVVTKVDLFANLYNPDAQYMIYWGMGLMFAGITWIYLVGCRAFLGYTAGEWVFDQRVGTPEQMNTLSYIPKVVARTLAVIGTGFVLFPLVSLITGQDVIGRLLGVELFRKA